MKESFGEGFANHTHPGSSRGRSPDTGQNIDSYGVQRNGDTDVLPGKTCGEAGMHGWYALAGRDASEYSPIQNMHECVTKPKIERPAD
jgi:hypothetical protein